MANGAYDFLAPFFRAAIITDRENPDNTRFPLWTLNTNDSKSLLGRAELNGMGSLAFLSELTIEMDLGFIPTVRATLTPPFEEGRKFINSTVIEWTRSVLEAEFGYADAPGIKSPKFQAFIQQPQVSIGTDFSITFEAKGLGGDGAVKTESNKTWENVSKLDVLKELAAKHGLSLDDSGLDADARTALSKKEESVTQSGQSDWYFMLRLAKETGGCWLVQVETSLKLLAINAAHSGEPSHTFRLFDFPRGRLGPANKTYPILDFSTETAGVYLAKSTLGMRVDGISSETREVVGHDISDKDGRIARNNKGAIAVETSQPKTLQSFPIDGASKDAKQLAESEYKSLVGSIGVKVNITSIGVPDLVPGMLIQVAGVAEARFDRKYTVQKVTHTLGSGGFTTSFVAFSNATELGGERPHLEAKVGNDKEAASHQQQPLALTDPLTVQAKAQG